MDKVKEDDKLMINTDINSDINMINSVFNNHFFKLIKELQCIIGLWPYTDPGFNKKIRHGLVCFFIFLLFIPIANGCRVWCGIDFDLCSENTFGVIYLTGLILKFGVMVMSENKIKFVLKAVAINWLTFTDPQERKIISTYAMIGKIKALGYFGFLACTAFVFTFGPMSPMILDLIKPLNESRKKILHVRAEFILIDPFEHYYEFTTFVAIMTTLSTCIFSGIDGLYVMIVHQNLAMISIVKYRFQLATNSFTIEKNRDYHELIRAIRVHKHSNELSETIKNTYSFSFLVVNGATIVFLSIAAVITLRILDDLKADSLFEIMRIGTLEIAALLHLFYLTWPGQQMLDHCNDLLDSVYANKWYNISQRGKKLLQILMIRFAIPNTITAGGISTMNFENYGTILKTTLSYITMAVSFR